jgi:multidrug resistance efflux pump
MAESPELVIPTGNEGEDRRSTRRRRITHIGQLAGPSQTLMSLVDEVEIGQPVEIDVDAYRGRTFTGHVESIQGATGARFALLPPDNATGNFAKVVQRVPVRVALDRRDPSAPVADTTAANPHALVDR